MTKDIIQYHNPSGNLLSLPIYQKKTQKTQINKMNFKLIFACFLKCLELRLCNEADTSFIAYKYSNADYFLYFAANTLYIRCREL